MMTLKMSLVGANNMQTITLIPGDGIGPEVCNVVKKVIKEAGLSINWEQVNAGARVMEESGTPLPDKVIKSIQKNKIALKGPITTPVGSGFRSVNVAMRKKLDLYVNLRPVRSFAGYNTDFKNIDLLIFRENTEGLYSGIEHMVGRDAAESIKVITRKATKRIVMAAFEYARREKRKRVTVVHKANIMKMSDGLFLETARDIAENYPDITFDDRIIDNMCMQLVQYPEDYDVLVMPNFYGDIISDLCSGLIGGLGLTAGANIGDKIAIFEAVHGSAPDIAGKNLANPIALLLSAVLMLRHINEPEVADKIELAVHKTLAEGSTLTVDLGGQASTEQMTADIINNL